MRKPLDGIFVPKRVAAIAAPEVITPVLTRPPVHRRYGDWLILGVGMLCVYIVGAPYWPSLVSPPHLSQALVDSQIQAASLAPSISPSSTALATAKQSGQQLPTTKSLPTPTPAPTGPNTLIIPKIGVDSPIADDATEAGLAHGAWHPSYTSTPDKGSNTVIAAHRFLYTSGPLTFYYLDRLQVGDTFTVIWHGVVYNYQVFETKVVTNTAVDIENATPDPEVTLFTCTPLWTSTSRLVVRARRT